MLRPIRNSMRKFPHLMQICDFLLDENSQYRQTTSTSKIIVVHTVTRKSNAVNSRL